MNLKIILLASTIVSFQAFASDYGIYACREEGSFQKVELSMHNHIAEVFGWKFLSTGITKRIKGISYKLFEDQGSQHLTAYISRKDGLSGSRSVILVDGDNSLTKKLSCQFERNLR